jgi:CheY-like chemotaxis protein
MEQADVGMTRPRVMVVEDEFVIRMTLSEALTDEGFDVMEASSAEEALEMVDADAPLALLLTDVQLAGGLDGASLARRMRERMPRMPVIFMTGRPDSMGDAAVAGHDVVVAKPYLLADICAAARRLVSP